MTRPIVAAFLLTGILLLVSTCNKDEIEPATESYIGTWIQADYTELFFKYYRAEEFIQAPGFSILEDGTFIEKKNSGWCGTPPISYTDYTGTWEAQNDTILTVDVPYWGGMDHYQMHLYEVAANTLRIVYLRSAKPHDND